MNAPQEPWFDHEELEVYREAVSFVAWLSSLLEEGGATGRGQRPVGPRIDFHPAEHRQRIVRMLMGLIKKNSTREYEKSAPTA
jgi:hypothetical protein